MRRGRHASGLPEAGLLRDGIVLGAAANRAGKQGHAVPHHWRSQTLRLKASTLQQALHTQRRDRDHAAGTPRRGTGQGLAQQLNRQR